MKAPQEYIQTKVLNYNLFILIKLKKKKELCKDYYTLLLLHYYSFIDISGLKLDCHETKSTSI